MADKITTNEKMTIKAIKVAIENVFEDLKSTLNGTRSEKKKNKLLIKRFSLELINNVVNNFEEVEGVAKVLKEVSLSIDAFADALKSGRGEEVVNYLIAQSQDNNQKKQTAKKVETKNIEENSQEKYAKENNKVQKVDLEEITEIKNAISKPKSKNENQDEIELTKQSHKKDVAKTDQPIAE